MGHLPGAVVRVELNPRDPIPPLEQNYPTNLQALHKAHLPVPLEAGNQTQRENANAPSDARALDQCTAQNVFAWPRSRAYRQQTASE